jgi:hypothetical protein
MKPDRIASQALARLDDPEHERFRKYLEGWRKEADARLVGAKDVGDMHRAQGEVRTLDTLLEHIRNARQYVAAFDKR